MSELGLFLSLSKASKARFFSLGLVMRVPDSLAGVLAGSRSTRSLRQEARSMQTLLKGGRLATARRD